MLLFDIEFPIFINFMNDCINIYASDNYRPIQIQNAYDSLKYMIIECNLWHETY